MIHGAHFLLYSTDPEADRGFLRDVLAWRFVDAGGGWLIFGLPPAELAVHPIDGAAEPEGSSWGGFLRATLHLMCDDLQAEMAALAAKGVSFAPVEEERWGIHTDFALPSGGRIGLYQPKHETALGLG